MFPWTDGNKFTEIQYSAIFNQKSRQIDWEKHSSEKRKTWTLWSFASSLFLRHMIFKSISFVFRPYFFFQLWNRIRCHLAADKLFKTWKPENRQPAPKKMWCSKRQISNVDAIFVGGHIECTCLCVCLYVWKEEKETFCEMDKRFIDHCSLNFKWSANNIWIQFHLGIRFTGKNNWNYVTFSALKIVAVNHRFRIFNRD